MPNWKKEVVFRDLILNYDLNADELKEIKRIKPLWVERFNSISDLKVFIPDLKKVRTQAQFNKWLDTVYNYCDMNRIWVVM